MAVDELEQTLRDFPRHFPIPPSLPDVRDRQASRARRRRRRRATGTAVVVLATLALTLFAIVRTPRKEHVSTDAPTTTARVPARGPSVTITPTDVSDGSIVNLRGTGFPPGPQTDVFVTMCPADPTKAASPDDVLGTCDGARGISVHPDGRSVVRARMRVFREMLGYHGWKSCATSCFVVTSWTRSGRVFSPITTAVHVTGANAPRPSLHVSRDSVTRTISGAAFQVDSPLALGVCGNGSEPTAPNCVYSGTWGGPTTDSNGAFTVNADSSEIVGLCHDPKGCFLAVTGGEGLPPIAATPL